MNFNQVVSFLVAALLAVTSFFRSGGNPPSAPTDPGADPGVYEIDPAPGAAPEWPEDADMSGQTAEWTPCIFHIAPEEVWLLPGERAELIVEAEPVLQPTEEPPESQDAAQETIVASSAVAAETEAETQAPEEPAEENRTYAAASEPVPEPATNLPAEEASVAASSSETPAEEAAEPVLSQESGGEADAGAVPADLPVDPLDGTPPSAGEPESAAPEGVLNCSFDPDLLEWRSENEAIAAVDPSGVVTAVSLGETVISVYLPDRDATATCAVSVVEELPATASQKALIFPFGYVAISHSHNINSRPTNEPVPLTTGHCLDFNVYRCDKNGTTIDKRDRSGSVVWYSDNPKVAKVDGNGCVTAVGEGTATISVRGRFISVFTVYNPVHVTVYRSFSSVHSGMTSNWVTQYRCTGKKSEGCKGATIQPGVQLRLFGSAGDYYYASCVGQGERLFMWKGLISDRTEKGALTICRSSDRAVRRHWHLYEGSTLTFQLTDGTSAAWTNSRNDTAVIALNNNASASGTAVTVKGIKAGAAYVTAKRNGAIDVIKIVVIKKYPAVKGAVTSGWCAQYQCFDKNCKYADRKVKDVRPGTALKVYGESGGYYYANVVGESVYMLMWKGNIELTSWTMQCRLQNTVLTPEEKKRNESPFFPQGFAVDDQYAYSFEVRRYEDKETGENIDEHRLYRYNLDTGALVQMKPTNTIGSLKHANDAAVVTFRENGRDQKYLFVTKYFQEEPCSIVKLGVNDTDGSYWKAAEYLLDREIAGISLYSGGGNQAARFLLKSGVRFFETVIPNGLPSQLNNPLSLTSKFWISDEYYLGYKSITVPQGIHYERDTDRLYLVFYGEIITSVVRCYNNIGTSSGTISESAVYEFTQSPYFEIEGIGFRSGNADRRIWFNLYVDYSAGGIYVDDKVLK